LISQAKVICQYQKDFNNEITSIRHDLILKDYPEEFIDSIMKPSRSNRPSSDTLYQEMVIIPYVKGVSPRNSNALETVSMLGSFLKLNIHSVGQ
jgi:hypothetical protein